VELTAEGSLLHKEGPTDANDLNGAISKVSFYVCKICALCRSKSILVDAQMLNTMQYYHGHSI